MRIKQTKHWQKWPTLLFLHRQKSCIKHYPVGTNVAKSEMSEDQTSSSALRISTPWANPWNAEHCWESRRIQNIPQSSCLAFAFRKDATAVPQLCQCVCRLLNICIKINMTAHAKPAIFPFTRGIIPEPRQILSFVHWPHGVNYVCCERTRRVPRVHGTVVLARWSMAGMLISRGVLQTPNCNWSLLLYH